MAQAFNHRAIQDSEGIYDRSKLNGAELTYALYRKAASYEVGNGHQRHQARHQNMNESSRASALDASIDLFLPHFADKKDKKQKGE